MDHWENSTNLQEELHNLKCSSDFLLTEFILRNFLGEYDSNSSLRNVEFAVRGKGDMNNGKSFEMNSFIKTKTYCNSLENTFSYEYSYIVYNNLRYAEALFITRALQESGVSSQFNKLPQHLVCNLNYAYFWRIDAVPHNNS